MGWTGPCRVSKSGHGPRGRFTQLGFTFGGLAGTDPSAQVWTVTPDRMLLRFAELRGISMDDEAAAAAAPDEQADILVDGAPIAFDVWRSPDGLSALARVGDRAILLVARGMSPSVITLARMTDLAPFLGRR